MQAQKFNNMKRRLFFCLGLCLTCLIQAQTRIAVIADPHVLAESLFDDGSAFEKAKSDNPRVVEYSQQLFDSAVAVIAEQRPDLVFIVGDLSNDGEKVSHQHIVAKLKELQIAGIQPIIIPGNNDIANKNAYLYQGDKKVQTESVSQAEFESLYSDFGLSQAVSREQDSLSYMVYPNDKLAVLCLNSAKKNTPTQQYNEGGIYESTLAWAEKAVAQAKKDNRMILALMHHQATNHFNMEEDMTPSYVANTTAEYPALEELQTRLLAAGVQVVFTGHYHMTSIKHTLNEGRQLYDVGTGSLSSYPSPIRWLTLSDDGQLNITTQTIDTYHELELERNVNTAKGIINRVADIAYPKIKSFTNNDLYKTYVIMFGEESFNLPSSKEQMISSMSACMLAPMKTMVNELSEGDENTRQPEENLQACMDGFDTYLVDTICVLCHRNAEMEKSMTKIMLEVVKEYRDMLNDMCHSVFFNYVGNDPTQVVPDNTNILQIDAPVTTKLQEINDLQPAEKVLKDGQLYIRQNNQLFDVVGKRVE